VPASAPSEDGPDNRIDNGTDGKETKKSNKGSQRVSQHVSPPNQLMPAIRRTSTIRRSRDEVTQRCNVGTCCRAEDSSPSKKGKYPRKRSTRLGSSIHAVTDQDDTRGSCRPATGCCVPIAEAPRAWKSMMEYAPSAWADAGRKANPSRGLGRGCSKQGSRESQRGLRL
jgi:hypothetical protein